MAKPKKVATEKIDQVHKKLKLQNEVGSYLKETGWFESARFEGYRRFYKEGRTYWVGTRGSVWTGPTLSGSMCITGRVLKEVRLFMRRTV